MKAFPLVDGHKVFQLLSKKDILRKTNFSKCLLNVWENLSLTNPILIADAVGFGVQIIVTAQAAVQRRRPKLAGFV